MSISGPSPSAAPKNQNSPSSGGALLVASGIFLSRIAGLIRERAFAHFFGNSMAADVFKAALRIPNFLQNLFGEGVLSASLIPVYAKLCAENKTKEADEVVRVVGTLLAISTSVLCALGIIFAGPLTTMITPGFSPEKAALTAYLVQIFFPGVGLLVMSAWCLGILNSHHKFFLSYSAPVLWNLAIISATIYYGPRSNESELAERVAWGLVAGCAAQLLVQIPAVLRLLNTGWPSLNYRLKEVQTVFKNFVPVALSRGVVQISAWIDSIIASRLPEGAIANISYAQTIYLLPISLFGMAVTAAELPRMSRATGNETEIANFLKKRIESSFKQIAFFVVPTAVAFFTLGDFIVGLLFQTGAFKREDTILVWATLAGSAVGLVAGTQGRLLSSAFYALKNTRTPFYISTLRVCFVIITGIVLGLYLPTWIGIDRKWGTAGLTAGFGIAAWMEFLILRKFLARVLGVLPRTSSHNLKLFAAAVFSAIVATGTRFLLSEQQLVIRSVACLIVYGLCYQLLCTHLLQIEEARRLNSRIFGPSKN